MEFQGWLRTGPVPGLAHSNRGVSRAGGEGRGQERTENRASQPTAIGLNLADKRWTNEWGKSPCTHHPTQASLLTLWGRKWSLFSFIKALPSTVILILYIPTKAKRQWYFISGIKKLSPFTYTVGMHACMLSHLSCVQLCDPMDRSLPGFAIYGDFPGKNTGVGCHALLQGMIFQPESHVSCTGRQILYH